MMEPQVTSTELIKDLWDDTVVVGMDPVERLVYRSNLLGSDWRITNTGGGNTSSKIVERDPLTGESVEVLWVKGSGGDLRTSTRANFSSLYQSRLVALQDVYARMDHRGPKTASEDAMVAMYNHCTFNLNPRACSIDTPLHSFVPYKHVDHTHPVACIALATAKDGPRLTQDVYGDQVLWVDWQRPGFELGLKLQELCRQNPNARGVILGGHGLINWADDDRACYQLTLELIRKAENYLERHDPGEKTFGGQKYTSLPENERYKTLISILPWLRGRVGVQQRSIATIQDDAPVLEFINSNDAERLAELGTSCPDHFLRTKIKPLYVEWDPRTGTTEELKQRLSAGLETYRKDYASYYEGQKVTGSPAMRDPNPTVILIPGLGMVAWGKTKSESRVTAEFYRAAIAVMRGAEAVSEYTALPWREAFDIEYWLLEEAKLKRMPPEKEMSRQIVVVFGAGSGIGREVVLRLVGEGATLAAVDLNEEAARYTADEVLKRVGMGIGLGGSGLSKCGDAIGLSCDVTRRESISAALDQVILAYGGFDHIAVTAGLYVSPDTAGRIPDESWARTYAVNVTGAYLVADEAARRWREQNLPGSLVITTSVNAAVAKRGSLAYDTSKAAANHLIRELAVELAPNIRVNGVAPATVVQGSSMFPRDRVIASLAKYGITFRDDEDSDVLRQRLAQFYADRTLTKKPVTPANQAEAIFLLLSERRLPRTTGQVLTVDGGLIEAFLR